MYPDAHVTDINCDMGESYGNRIIGNDEAIFPHITSCNIACGFHGGDPAHMDKTVRLALEHGVQIGAHPSYPDRENFGRKKMKIPPGELRAILQYQIGALCGMTAALGGRVRYVKPHGALYNTAAEDVPEARVIVEAVMSMRGELALMGLAGSAMEQVARDSGLFFIAEAFADRTYQANGTLVPRNIKGAVIDDPQAAAAQAVAVVIEHKVTTLSGEVIPVIARSICVHGDHPHTLAVLHGIDEAFKKHGIEKRAFDKSTL
jgi:UPF0271 protein